MTQSTAEGGGIREFDKLITADDQQYYSGGPGKHKEQQFIPMPPVTFHLGYGF
jgi:hypothetical protein